MFEEKKPRCEELEKTMREREGESQFARSLTRLLACLLSPPPSLFLSCCGAFGHTRRPMSLDSSARFVVKWLTSCRTTLLSVDGVLGKPVFFPGESLVCQQYPEQPR